ncbi:MAG: SidA/IucD/PvdA family monooxygenase, partial [Hyphomicrobiaceae bacterium]
MAAALKSHGVPYEQVDASDGIGGNWRHGVYTTAHIVSSKRSTAFADYPMPADYPDFPSGSQMLAYLQSFARDRDLLGAITLNRKVVKSRPLPDVRWRVEFEDGETATYKGLVVCNGHHWDRCFPVYPGNFDGPMMHSKDFKQPADVAGKRVLVIGGGNSGCDMACEAARTGRSSDISLRSGYWFLPKIAFGRPLTDLPIWSLPVPLQRLILRLLVRVTIGDYRRYGLSKPS